MDYATQYQEYLARVNRALETACDAFLPEESEVCRAARYSLLGGGKRIRAVLVLAVCDMLNGDAAAAEQFAAAVEMLHCYSLIHALHGQRRPAPGQALLPQGLWRSHGYAGG